MSLTFLEEVKNGRKYYGAIYGWSKGKVYIASRLRADIFRNGHNSLTAAADAGDTAWAIDTTTLTRMRLKGVKLVGIYQWDDETLYLTTMDKYMDLGQTKDYSTRNGARQRYLRYGKDHPAHFKILARCPAPEKLKKPRPKKPKKPR